MSQEEILHLLPSKIQLVVIIALNCLCLIHRVIQRQEKLLEGFHHRWWHTQVNLCNATQPGVGKVGGRWSGSFGCRERGRRLEGLR